MTDIHQSPRFWIKHFFLRVAARVADFRKRSFRNPFFYFALVSLALAAALFFSVSGLDGLGNGSAGAGFFNTALANTYQASLAGSFLGQQSAGEPATPTLGIIQDNFIAALAPPHAVALQTLGDISSGASSVSGRKEVVNYTVRPGDTTQSVADQFGISLNTVLWANNLSKNSSIAPGDKLVILPVSGVIHVVKVGDTIAELAKAYRASSDDIISFNGLRNEEDVYVGDVLIIPNGIESVRAGAAAPPPVANNFFIFPLLHFIITQGLHYYNAIDIQSLGGFGSPVYASAAGTVQRAAGNGGWNLGMGNYVTILHSNGLVTYYGHLNSVMVQPGQHVDVGQQIGTEGQTGDATGPHVHFQVMGGKNPLAGYPLCTEFDNGKLVKYGNGGCMK